MSDNHGQPGDRPGWCVRCGSNTWHDWKTGGCRLCAAHARQPLARVWFRYGAMLVVALLLALGIVAIAISRRG